MSETVDRRLSLLHAPMSRAQIAAVIMTVLLSALDGYDVLSVTFAAPAISQSWGIGRAALGLVLASGLAGMAFGSLALAPLADVIGRRRIVLCGLGLMVAGSLLSAVSRNVAELAAWRVLTGVGIGVMVAVITPLAAEFANTRWRSFAVSAMAVGYPVGGVLGGVTASALLQRTGWQGVFVAGAAAGVLLVPAVLVWLPEPPAFLLARRRPDTLSRVNAFLTRCGRPTIDALPPMETRKATSYRGLFANGLAGTTLRITIVNLLYVMSGYYFLSWLPQLVADAGFPPASASLVSAAANLAGAVGGLVLGWVATRFGPTLPSAGAMIGFAAAMIALGLAPASLATLTVAAACCGFFLIAGISCLYAALTMAFDAPSRASGAGFVIGIGRIGSALGPYAAGWMFASGLARSEVTLTFAVLAGLAGLLMMSGRLREDDLGRMKTT